MPYIKQKELRKLLVAQAKFHLLFNDTMGRVEIDYKQLFCDENIEMMLEEIYLK